MSDKEAVVHVPPCTSAEEFLDSLSPRGKYLVGEHDSDSYIKAEAYNLNRIASQRPAREAKIREVTFVTAPTASNPNLRAQMGVFTFHRKEHVELDAPADREPMDCVVRSLKAQDDIHNTLIEFSLPISESPKLLHLLARENIDAATLFPGYGGVAKALREKQYWD